MRGAPKILTFGCRLNTFESEAIRRHVRDAGLADTVIVNTCAVTAEAERQARQAIRRARREHPSARIIVTGCAAQIDPARYAAMPEVDTVLGNEEKLKAESYRDRRNDAVSVADVMAVREMAPHMVEGFEGRARAFLQVQQGCDHRCTFCIIPFGRGNSRSAPVDTIVGHARKLVEAGYAEIVLTGVDITGYGADLPDRPSLGTMAQRLLSDVQGMERLRLSSVDCMEVAGDAMLMRLIAEEKRLMPHLHLSLQSGDDMILKRMKRRHSRRDAVEFCRRARALRPGIAFGADLIAGFPTETGAMFENTMSLIEDCDLAWLHVFPYSPRNGTPAARMPQVPVVLRKERAARLRAAGETAAARFMERQVGRTASVLVERGDGGYSEHYAPVRLTRPAPDGNVVDVRLTGCEGNRLVGAPESQAA